MSFLKYAIPALAVAGRAAAQCSAATTTIQNQGDAAGIAGCTTFSGSIAIATGTTDNIDLTGIRRIAGSLIADNVTQITQISAGSLETITDAFNLNELTILSTLNFPRLTNVGSIEWEALPALQGLSFTTGVQTADSVSIQNTQLNSLDGINLQVVDSFYIANNIYLEDIEMQLGNISTSLVLEANGQNVSAVFPNLMWAFNMTFRNVTSISIPSLASLNGSMGFYSNEITSVNAPNLTTVGGSLSFVSNSQLTNISMPSLTTVGGGFQVDGNSELDSISGFPKLKTIGGALAFNGGLSNISLPALGDVRGAFNITSTENVADACAYFKNIAGSNKAIRGKFTCKGANDSGASASGSSTRSAGSSATASSAAIPAYVPMGATGLMGVLAAIFGLL